MKIPPPVSQNHELSPLICPQCGHGASRYPNFWGTVCSACHGLIPPSFEHPLVARNRERRERLVREHIWPIIEKALLAPKGPHANQH
jgi:hypothetical protein